MDIYRIILPTDIYKEQQFNITPSVKYPYINITNIPFPEQINSDLPIDYEYHKKLYGFHLTKQEIIDFIIHRKIWKDFLLKNNPYCLIIESNVKLNTSIDNIIQTINKLSKETDLDIFFPYEINISQKNGLELLNPNIREKRNKEPYYLGYKWGNHVYILTRKGAIKLTNINCIKNRLDNILIELSYNNKINAYYDNVKWIKKNNIDNKEWPKRINYIWEYILSFSSWTKKSKQNARLLLNLISKISKQNKINLILQGGTHLGFVRHNGIMPWDDDIDIGIEQKDILTFLQLLNNENKLKYDIFIEQKTKTPYYKIWLENGEYIDNVKYKFPFVDVWIYDIVKNDFIFKDGIICPNSALYKFKSIVFEGSNFKIPGNSIEVLNSRYIDWKTKVRVYSWSHRLEKPSFPWIDIPFQI